MEVRTTETLVINLHKSRWQPKCTLIIKTNTQRARTEIIIISDRELKEDMKEAIVGAVDTIFNEEH